MTAGGIVVLDPHSRDGSFRYAVPALAVEVAVGARGGAARDRCCWVGSDAAGRSGSGYPGASGYRGVWVDRTHSATWVIELEWYRPLWEGPSPTLDAVMPGVYAGDPAAAAALLDYLARAGPPAAAAVAQQTLAGGRA